VQEQTSGYVSYMCTNHWRKPCSRLWY